MAATLVLSGVCLFALLIGDICCVPVQKGNDPAAYDDSYRHAAPSYGPQPGPQPGPRSGPGFGPQPGPQPGPGFGPQPGQGLAPQSGPGYGPEPGPRSGPGYGPQPGPGYGPQPGQGLAPQPGPGFGPQPGPGYGPGFGPQSGQGLAPPVASQSGPGYGPEPGPRSGPGYGPQPGPGYGPGFGPQSGQGVASQSGPGHGPEPGPGYGPQPGPGYGPQPGPGLAPPVAGQGVAPQSGHYPLGSVSEGGSSPYYYPEMKPGYDQPSDWYVEPAWPHSMGKAPLAPAGVGSEYIGPPIPQPAYQGGELTHYEDSAEHGFYERESDEQGQFPHPPHIFASPKTVSSSMPHPFPPRPLPPHWGFYPYYYDYRFITGQYPPGTYTHASANFEHGRDAWQDVHYHQEGVPFEPVAESGASTSSVASLPGKAPVVYTGH